MKYLIKDTNHEINQKLIEISEIMRSEERQRVSRDIFNLLSVSAERATVKTPSGYQDILKIDENYFKKLRESYKNL